MLIVWHCSPSPLVADMEEWARHVACLGSRARLVLHTSNQASRDMIVYIVFLDDHSLNVSGAWGVGFIFAVFHILSFFKLTAPKRRSQPSGGGSAPTACRSARPGRAVLAAAPAPAAGLAQPARRRPPGPGHHPWSAGDGRVGGAGAPGSVRLPALMQHAAWRAVRLRLRRWAAVRLRRW
eukprot:SAG22_NODE_3192_length_1864_cov_20.852125_2_plen_180_part_00